MTFSRHIEPEIDEIDRFIFGEKLCPLPSGCGRQLPATTEYFAVDEHLEGGLTALCKICRNRRMRRYDVKRSRSVGHEQG